MQKVSMETIEIATLRRYLLAKCYISKFKHYFNVLILSNNLKADYLQLNGKYRNCQLSNSM